MLKSVLTQRVRYMFPILLGFLFTLCTYIGQHNGLLERRYSTLIISCIFFCIFFALSFHTFEQFLLSERTHHENKLFRFLPLTPSPISIIISTLVLILFWIPYLIAAYPGIFWYDTSWQVYDLVSSSDGISDHHPFFTTYLFGVFIHLGQILFHNPIIGLYLLTTLQLFITAFALASAICTIERYNIPWHIRALLLTFFAICPFFPMIFSTLAKDTLNLPFFLFFVICILEILHTQGKSLRKIPFSILFTLDILLMSLTKKTCIYIAVFCLLSLFFILKEKYERIAVSLTILTTSGIIIFLLPTFLYPVLHIEHGENSELLALPLQQVANLAKNNKDAISPEDQDILETIYGQSLDSLASSYLFYVADPIKSNVNIPSNLLDDFIRIWAKYLILSPSDYIAAWGGLNTAWFSFDIQTPTDTTPNMITVQYSSAHYMQGLDSYIQWPQDTLANNTVTDFYQNNLLTTPLVNTFFYKSLWSSILPFFLMFIVCRKKQHLKDNLILLSPILVTCLTLYVGPTSSYREATRYVLPLVCTIPIISVIIFQRQRTDNTLTKGM